MKSHRVISSVVASAIAGFVGISSASAADLGPYRSYEPPPPAPVAYQEAPIWQGAYAGINGGYAWSNSDAVNPNGVFGGAQIGYNWQRDHLVFGVEADGQASDIGAHDDLTGFKTFMPWFSTVRGRLGWANGPFLLYATGGVAFADIENQVDFAATSGRADGVETGYAVGGGLEYAFTPRWSMKAEYLFLGFGDRTLSDGVGNEARVNNDVHAVRLGLNYKF